MGRKTICEKCNSIFEAKAVEDMMSCPVCNSPFDEDESESFNFGNPDLYFYDIDGEEESDDGVRDVWCQCTSCRGVNTIPHTMFNILDVDCLKLKDNTNLTCEGCGKQIDNVIVPRRPHGWRETHMRVTDWGNQPKCPICKSGKIHKISLTNKAASALAFGLLAAGHVSKTYKCDTCGSEF